MPQLRGNEPILGLNTENEKYDGGDVFLGDDSTTKIMGCGRVKLLLKYGRVRTLC